MLTALAAVGALVFTALSLQATREGAEVTSDELSSPLDLGRVLAEHAALVAATLAGEAVLNHL